LNPKQQPDFLAQCLHNKTANKNAQAANDAITTLLAPIKHWVKTLTFDNGNLLWEELP
jgi:IS30 family transposase